MNGSIEGLEGWTALHWWQKKRSEESVREVLQRQQCEGREEEVEVEECLWRNG